jgi:GNAT superfamily N-acetyltransferase
MTLRLDTLAGAAARPHLASLASLRAEVFREWPYLYAGDAEEEARYLESYADGRGAAIVVALDGAQAVGAATCQPMVETHAAVRQAFAGTGRDITRMCYFGESVLRAAYRGQGAGVGFFAAREAHARALGLTTATFCAVVRHANDPRKPAGYTPLDGFWTKRGYTHHPQLSCVMRWREVEDDRETPHALSLWMKDLV